MPNSRQETSLAPSSAEHCLGVPRPNPDKQSLSLDWLCLLYRIHCLIRYQGLLSIESFVDAPQESSLLICAPSITAGPELDFVCDILRMMIDGPIDAFAMRRQYIQEASATRRMASAEADRIAAIGWFPLLGFFPPEKTLLALWQQLPLALRPDLSDLKQRLDEIQVVQQRESWGYRRRARQQKIRRFVASLNVSDSSGSPA